MIKAIIFDFDGVILESADIKTEAFKELFSLYPEKVDEIVEYHLLNGGISRYVKFCHIYKNILRKKLSQATSEELGKGFSEIVLNKVLKTPFVSGIMEFLNMNKHKYMFFIASGTPEEELCYIVKARRLKDYFREVHGSPKTKVDIINGILIDYNFTKDEIAYVGDSQSDKLAAEETGIVYIERKANKGLFDLGEILEKIEKRRA